MEKTKKITLGVLSIATIGMIGAAGVASAYMGDPSMQGPNFDAALHDAKIEAFESGDYAVWRDLMEQSGSRGKVLEVVNENNFNTFVDMHNALLEGNTQEADELRAELGLGQGLRDGTGFRQGGGQDKGSQMQSANFVDANSDGVCDNNDGTQMKRSGRGRR